MLERKCQDLPSDTALILLLFGKLSVKGKRKPLIQALLLNTASISILYSFLPLFYNKKPIVLSSEYMLHSLHYVHNSGQLGVLRYFGGWIYYLFSHAAILLQCFVNLCASFGFGCMHGVKML